MVRQKHSLSRHLIKRHQEYQEYWSAEGFLYWKIYNLLENLQVYTDILKILGYLDTRFVPGGKHLLKTLISLRFITLIT